jgi:hypothetical protein
MRKHILTATVMAAFAGLNHAAIAEESTTISGKGFFDFSSIDQTTDGAGTAASGLGFDVKRFYVGIDHKFDDIWSANVTTDFNYVSNDSETQVYIKKAYFQAKFSDAAALRVGSADLPWVGFAESVYGYRWVENTLIDRLKWGTSADWGAHFFGKQMDGKLGYALSAINGNGYKDPSRSKSVDFEGRVSFNPVEALTLAVGFYNGKLGQETDIDSAANTFTRINALVGYDFGMFKVGAEYVDAKNPSKTAISTGPKDNADGVSVWGSFSPAEKYTVFARYDQVNYQADAIAPAISPEVKDTYYNVGVSYQYRKNVDVALVYKGEKVENGTLKTSNGTIGGAGEGKYNEIGVWAQVKF